MTVEESKGLVRRYVEAANARSLDRFDELLPSDYTHHDPSLPPELQRGRDGHKRLVQMFFTAFPDLRGTIDDLIAEGDRVVTRMTWRGTHRGDLMGIPPTGKQVSISEMCIYRIAGGKIAEGWVNFDALGMMQQLGAIPTPPEQPQPPMYGQPPQA